MPEYCSLCHWDTMTPAERARVIASFLVGVGLGFGAMLFFLRRKLK